jgi:hypothetical protein
LGIAHVTLLPDICVLHLYTKTLQRAFRWTILYPKVQLLLIGYPRIGAAVDGVPAMRVPRADAEARKTNRSQIVRYAAAEGLSFAFVNNSCCMAV